MTRTLDTRMTGLAALGIAGLAAAVLHLLSPPPLAETRRGSEAAFATRGLEAREIEEGVLARRWAGPELALAFVNLPSRPPRPRGRGALATAPGGGEPRGRGARDLAAGHGTLPRTAWPRPAGGRLDLTLARRDLRGPRGPAARLPLRARAGATVSARPASARYRSSCPSSLPAAAALGAARLARSRSGGRPGTGRPRGGSPARAATSLRPRAVALLA